MNPFFAEPDLGRCFMELTAYQPVIQGAYRLAGLLLQETVNKQRQAAVLTLAHLQQQSGLSGPTVKVHLESLRTAGIFPFAELGSGSHKEVLVVLGTALGIDLLERQQAGTMSIAELMSRAQLSENNFHSTENILAEDKNLSSLQNISGLSENNLHSIKNIFTSSEDLNSESDSETDLSKSDSQNSEADKVSDETAPADKPAELTQQLSFGTNLAADMGESVLSLPDYHRAPPVAEPPPAAPADILPIRPASEQPAAGTTSLKDGLQRMGFNPDAPTETYGDRMRRQAQAAPPPDPAVAARQNARFAEEQLKIAQIQARGIGTVVHELCEKYIHAPAGGFTSFEPQRRREFIEDLERGDARLLLLLDAAFERASASAKSVSAARINVAEAASAMGIHFLKMRPKRAS